MNHKSAALVKKKGKLVRNANFNQLIFKNLVRKETIFIPFCPYMYRYENSYDDADYNLHHRVWVNVRTGTQGVNLLTIL